MSRLNGETTPRFTPGPWASGGDSVYAQEPYADIASVFENDSVAEQEANASLMACAPELYEALHLASKYVAKVHYHGADVAEEPHVGPYESCPLNACASIREVLAKAVSSDDGGRA